MRSTPRTVVIVAAMAVGLVAGCSSSDGDRSAADTTAAADPTTTVPGEAGGGELLVLTATGGTLGADTLELTGADPEVTVFTDRPARSATAEVLAQVMDAWASLGFVADPPNAALVTRGPAGQVTTVVELGQPTVADDGVTFPVTPVEQGEADGLLARLPSDDQPEELSQPALFIDSGAAGSLVAVTIDGTWGAGTTKVSLDGWTFSTDGGTSMGFQMGEPGTISFDAYEGFLALTAVDAVEGTFSGVGLLDEGTLSGQAVLADGSGLTIGVCGPNGPTQALATGQYEIALPSSC